MEKEVGEERLQPRRRGAVDGPTVDGQAELTEETDLQCACHLNPPSTLAPFRSQLDAQVPGQRQSTSARPSTVARFAGDGRLAVAARVRIIELRAEARRAEITVDVETGLERLC
jgi:hypothetical protein